MKILHLFIFSTYIFHAFGNESLNLDEYLQSRGFDLSPVHSQKNEGYSSVRQREEFLNDLTQLSSIHTIMEIGFNAGHSSETFLQSPGCQKLLAFDIEQHPYTRTGVEFMQQKFKDRFEFIKGNSRIQVPLYAQSHPGVTFDLIFIDGDHSFEGCIADIRNSRLLANRNTILWIDDYIPAGIKPAVDYCVQNGELILLNDKFVSDVHGDRSWAIARYPTESEQIFNRIYKNATWGKDAQGKGSSGPGSTLEQGRPFIAYVQQILNQKSDIRTVVDIGCGDWVLGREIDWGNRNYIGIDVVESLVKQHQINFGSQTTHFVHLDVIQDPLPNGDLVLCKDVLIHWPNTTISQFLTKLKQFKYCIIVNDIDSISLPINQDISTGEFRPLNLTLPPFSLQPIETHYYFSGKNCIKQILLLKNI